MSKRVRLGLEVGGSLEELKIMKHFFCWYFQAHYEQFLRLLVAQNHRDLRILLTAAIFRYVR